jgi:hypothetical protein
VTRLFVLLTLFTSFSLQAATSKPKKTHATPKAAAATPARKYLDGPFDDTAGSLPPHFIGNSIEKIHLQQSLAPKSEFESSAQYDARVLALPSGTYAFQLTDRAPSYDADRQVFKYAVYFKPLLDRVYAGHEAIEVRNIETSRREYQASNAFGATVAVRDVTSKSYVILSEEHLKIDNTVHIEVPIAGTDAPNLKPRLGLLVVCRTAPELATDRLEADNSSSVYVSSRATISTPFEYTESYYVLRAHVLGFWVYDQETGRVIEKFDAFGKPATEKPAPLKIQLLPTQ